MWVREETVPILATVVGTASTPLLDRFLQTHFQFLRLSLLLQRDRSDFRDPLVLQLYWAHNQRKGWRHCSSYVWIVFNNTMGDKMITDRRFLIRPPISVKITGILEKTTEFREMAIMIYLSGDKH